MGGSCGGYAETCDASAWLSSGGSKSEGKGKDCAGISDTGEAKVVLEALRLLWPGLSLENMLEGAMLACVLNQRNECCRRVPLDYGSS